jgi:uncharacterized protein YbaR (Trm112 family)
MQFKCPVCKGSLFIIEVENGQYTIRCFMTGKDCGWLMTLDCPDCSEQIAVAKKMTGSFKKAH